MIFFCWSEQVDDINDQIIRMSVSRFTIIALNNKLNKHNHLFDREKWYERWTSVLPQSPMMLKGQENCVIYEEDSKSFQ